MKKKPTIAFIAGSGLAQGLEGMLDSVEKQEDILNEFGKVLSYYTGENDDTKVIILPRHGDSKGTPARSPAELVAQNGYEANIWQLHKLGADAIIGFTAVGSLDTDLPLASEGHFGVPVSYIRGLASSQHSFGKRAKNVHTPMSDPFDVDLNNRVMRAMDTAGVEYDEVVYIYNGGDAFETPHEIAVLDRITKGGFGPHNQQKRVVGMTTVPEVMLANQLNIPFSAVCSNVNYAEGLSNETPVSHGQTLDVMGKAEPYILNIAEEIVRSYK